MYEAYMYIKTNEHRNEQPQYNDDGTGNVTNFAFLLRIWCRGVFIKTVLCECREAVVAILLLFVLMHRSKQ